MEDTSQRDILIAENAQTYTAATEVAASSTFSVRNPKVKGAATSDANGVVLSAVTLDAAAGGATTPQAFSNSDWVAVRLPGGEDVFRQVTVSAGASLTVAPALPTAMHGQNVEIRRLDAGVVRLNKDTQNICRTITFVRGSAIHYSKQIPEAFPATAIAAKEYLPAVRRDQDSGATFHSESIVVQLGADSHQADFNVDNFVRIRKGSTYHGRRIVRRHGTANLVLDATLPPLTAPEAYDPVEIVRLDAAGAAVNNQAATGDLVDCGNLTDLRKFHGVAITAGGATDRRIVIGLFVRCPIAVALPASLLGVDLTVEVVIPGADASGAVASNTTIMATAGQASHVKKDRPIRIRAGANEFFTAVANISGDVITLAQPMPAAFTNGLAVTATDLAASRSFDGSPSAAPGDQVTLAVDTPNVSPIVAPSIGPVKAGDSVTFQMPLPPIAPPMVPSPLPAGATVNASVTSDAGRPATLTFHAPDRVDADVDVNFDMVYRIAPEKKVTATVRVTKN